MTLILTALCKNGICVCADKRSRTWTGGALRRTEDNLNKIYKFNNAPLIIFNHGVNKFNNKSWREFCFEYEDSNRWEGKSIELIGEDFKSFIEDDVVRQLEHNIRSMPSVDGIRQSAFVLCGKDINSNSFEFFELYWSPEPTTTHWKDTRIIGSGEGYKKYLEQYLIDNSQSNTVEFWGSINTTQATEKLKRLFSIAIGNRNNSEGDEFSDNYDIKCIT